MRSSLLFFFFFRDLWQKKTISCIFQQHLCKFPNSHCVAFAVLILLFLSAYILMRICKSDIENESLGSQKHPGQGKKTNESRGELHHRILSHRILMSKCQKLTTITHHYIPSRQDPRVFFFCFSLSLLPLLFPLLSFFFFIILHRLRSPPVSLDIHAVFCSPLSLSSLYPCLLFQSGGDPFAYGEKKKKRLVSNLNNCASQFSSSWTLWGKNERGMTLYQDELSQAFVSMFFTG